MNYLTQSLGIVLLSSVFSVSALAAPPEFRYGFGIGVNFSNISEVNQYSLFEDLTGTGYNQVYTPLFSNFGNQYFFHGEFRFSQVLLALKPGTYTYRFSKYNEVIFQDESVENLSAHLLRYINVPIEAKWIIGQNSFKPFIGGSLSYGQLLSVSGSENNAFIRPNISGGPIGGIYYELPSFDLNLTLGYNYNVHVITRKTNRSNAVEPAPYAQSDIKLNNLHASLSILFAFDKSKVKKALDCVYPNARRPKSSKNTTKPKTP